MKKYLIPFLLLTPLTAFALSVSWDRPAVGQINPLYILDQVKGNYFTATSTTQTNTFPHASTTQLTIGAQLFDSANSAGSNGNLLQTTGSATQWVATSSLGLQSTLPTGTNGQILAWLLGVPTWTASTSVAAGTGISVSASGAVTTVTNTGVTSLTATSPLSRDTATGAVTISCASCSTFGNNWQIINGALTPTTTLGIIVNASSSVSSLFQ
jgi:hypothetical protein